MESIALLIEKGGGWAGLAIIVGAFLYINEERRYRTAKSIDTEAEAKQKEVSSTDQIEKMSLKLTKEFEERYNAKVKESDHNSTLVIKLTHKIDRIIQIIRQNIEYRNGLPIKSSVKEKMVSADTGMMEKINAIVIENGASTD